MMMFAKWSSADPRYREYTYKKALCIVEDEIKKVETKIIENKTDETIRDEFCELMFSKNKKPHQATELLVKYVKSKKRIYTTKVDMKNESWLYIEDGENEGLTIPNGCVAIKELLRKVLGIYYDEHLYKQVMSKIEADSYVDYDSFFNSSYDGKFAVKNGILNIETRELLPFSSDYIFFKKAEMSYNQSSKCENYINFLKELGLNENFIFELMATAFLKENRMKKMAIFNGEADNGKSTLLETFRMVFGSKFCTAIPLHMLKQNSFALDKLRDAKFNIAGDIPDNDTEEIGSIKSLTGYDAVTIQRKFLPSIDTVLSVQHIFSCNKLPSLKKADKAFFNRVALIDFPYKFISQSEYDLIKDKSNVRIAKKGILQEILTDSEKSGVLNEILNAYDRIIKNGEFSLDRNSEEVKMIWIRRSNSFMAFCLDHVEERPNCIIPKSLLRYIYGIYCKKHKLTPMSDFEIKSILTKDYAANGDTRIDNEHMWTGIYLQYLSGLPGVLNLYEKNIEKFRELETYGSPDVKDVFGGFK
jgi:P4 family phage/plasmid primase-like protien